MGWVARDNARPWYRSWALVVGLAVGILPGLLVLTPFFRRLLDVLLASQ